MPTITLWLAALMAFLGAFVGAIAAHAQESDVRKVRTAGVYSVGCALSEIDPSVVSACFVRADLVPVDELGCTSTPDADGDYHMDVTVQQTTFDDAELRCYLVDDGQLVSGYSLNQGIIDFTPPAKGIMR